MKKFFTSILIVILLIIGILACATFSYSKSSEFKNDKFPANTKINGIDCSNLTYKQAASKLTEQWNKKQIIVTGSLENTVATFTDFDCTYDIDKNFKNQSKKTS